MQTKAGSLSLSQKKKIQQLFASEIYTLEAYVTRLFHVILKIKKPLKANSDLTNHLCYFRQELCALINKTLACENASSEEKINFEELEKQLAEGLQFARSLLWIQQDIYRACETVREIINCYYENCHTWHLLIDPDNSLKIQLPRTEMIGLSDPEETIPKFSLTKQAMREVVACPSELRHLEQIRDDQYEHHLRQGHHHIYEKAYKKALDSFVKASKIKATSQCMNLIGWVHSLEGNVTEAKEYCLKAIKLDPHVGDPYNDMGSYLLLEGKIKECLTWFNLAKKAKYYVNREFPYINAGKAYLMEKDYHSALNEFNQALKFVPYQKELKKTITKLKNMILQRDQRQ